jgi:hypothetical protein
VLTTYLASLSPQDVDTFLREACSTSYHPEQGQFKSEQERQERRGAILANPRFHVWKTALFYLAITSMNIDTEMLKQKAEKAERETLMREAATAQQIRLGGRKEAGFGSLPTEVETP